MKSHIENQCSVATAACREDRKVLWRSAESAVKASVSLVGGESCETEPPFVNSHPLDLWLWRKSEAGLLCGGLQNCMSCLKLICRYFVCSYTKRIDWVTLTRSCREAPHRKICQCKKWHILTELKYLSLFNVGFIPSSLLIRGMLLTLLYESGQWDAGRLNGDTKVTYFGRGWS